MKYAPGIGWRRVPEVTGCGDRRIRVRGFQELLGMEESDHGSSPPVELDDQLPSSLSPVQVWIPYDCPDIPIQSSSERKFGFDLILAPNRYCNGQRDRSRGLFVRDNPCFREGGLVVFGEPTVIFDHVAVADDRLGK